MNTWLLVVGAWLADFAWIATALLVAAAAMRLVLRDPGSRVLLAWGTWLAIAIGAVLSATPWWPRYQLADLIEPPAVSAPIAAEAMPATLSGALVLIEPMDVAVESTSVLAMAPGVDVSIPLWPQVLLAGWLAAAVVAGGWVAMGFWQARRLLRTTRPAPLWVVEEMTRMVTVPVGNALRGVPGAAVWRPLAAHGTPQRASPTARIVPEVFTSQRLSSAVALGALRPRIVLPEASAVETNLKAVRAALAHEWAHIRHGDLWLLAVERLLVPLLAVHPLFWWLRKSTRLDQELLADAAAAGDQPVEYAEALVAWAKTPASATIGLAALAMWERPSNLSRRVYMILNCKRPLATGLRRMYGLAAVCLLLGLGGVLSTFTVHRLSADDEPAAKPIEPTTEKPAQGPSEVVVESVPAPAAADVEEDEPRADLGISITLGVTMFALDRGEFPETKKQVVEVVEQAAGKKLERITSSRSSSSNPNRFQSAGALVAEIDKGLESRLLSEIRVIDGVKLLSRATIITPEGQDAQLDVAEKRGRVVIQKEIDGNVEEEEQHPQGPAYWVRVKPRISSREAERLELTINAGRSQPNVIQPSTTIKSPASIGKTLVIVSSEPYAILISPTNVERQAAPLGVDPARRGPVTIRPTPLARYPVPARVADARQPAAAASGLEPLPAASREPSAATTATAASGEALLLDQLQKALAQLARERDQRIRESSALRREIAEPTATRHPATTPAPADSETPHRTLPDVDKQTLRKLLELDLAAARLEVEAAQVELDEAMEIRQKNPGAVSEQELRKRQLQIERAKIQVQRIQVQLEAASKQVSAAPANTAPPPKRNSS